MFKIGVRAHDYGKREPEALAKVIHEHGWTCTQLALPRAISDITSFDDVPVATLDQIRKNFENYGVEISVLSCYMDIGNPDNAVRNHAVSTLKKCLNYCKELGAKMVGTETAYSFLSEAERQFRYPYMLDSIHSVIEEAQKLDVKLAIEPVHFHPLCNAETVSSIITSIDDPEHLKVIFDASNLLTIDKVASQKQYWIQWLDQIGKHIEIYHMKDFYYDEDGKTHFVPLGKGVIDYSPILDWIYKSKKETRFIREELIHDYSTEDFNYLVDCQKQVL